MLSPKRPKFRKAQKMNNKQQLQPLNQPPDKQHLQPQNQQ